MINIALHEGELPKTGSVVVTVGHDRKLSSAASRLDDALQGQIQRAAELAREMKHAKVIDLIPPQDAGLDRVFVLCLGKEDGLSTLDIEEAGAALAVRLGQLEVETATVATTDGLELGHDTTVTAASLASGAMLKSYSFRKYKSKQEDDPRRLQSLRFQGSGADAEAALESVRNQCAGVALARDLVSEPANTLYPESFADRCRDLEALGVEVEVLDAERLAELGMGAILAVGQGSDRPPHAVVMRWNGGAADEEPLALVGKGVCFDTGGISLKPSAGMEEMKWDMGGAAAVVGAMHAIAARKAAANIVGIVGLAENMPSGKAQRPGDVITAMSGTTIEVINTDAEGRLLLADMVWYAQDRFKPRAIIDLATLTGAIIIALGHEHAGLFASDDELAEQLSAAGRTTGETLWRMPLGKAYDKHIKSEIADIKNVGRARQAGATAGAVFVQRFTNGVPWAHLDIAAMAWTNQEKPLAAKGGTGFGVRLLDQLVADQESA